MIIPENAVVVVFGPNGATVENLLSYFEQNIFVFFFRKKTEFYFLDYPCSGLSKKASFTTENVINSALDLYRTAFSKKEDRPLWMITMSVGMAVFSSILPYLKKSEQPDVIFCMNGLMSMRKTVLKVLPITRLYYYGLKKDYNTARLISENLSPDVIFFWVQNNHDRMIDLNNLKKSIERWKKEKRLKVHLLERESTWPNNTHNDFDLFDGLTIIRDFEEASPRGSGSQVKSRSSPVGITKRKSPKKTVRSGTAKEV